VEQRPPHAHGTLSLLRGVVLDVTPQIDDAEMITLHLRPSVTTVTEKTKQIDLGTIGNYRCRWPAASTRPTAWCAWPMATSSPSAA
jgi:Flp pilus assembly secretin CpaC